MAAVHAVAATHVLAATLALLKAVAHAVPTKAATLALLIPRQTFILLKAAVIIQLPFFILEIAPWMI